MGKEEFITIPHFINPHLFWYHKVDGQNPDLIESQRIERAVQQLFTAKQSAALCPYRPRIGEVVAVAFVSWNKHIRARVDYIAKYTKSEDQYIVWALDYGFPFQTKTCYIRKLPESFALSTNHIRLGAIANILPAELDFDFVTTSSRMVIKKSWPKRAVDLLEKVINDAASVSFIESFCENAASQMQHFGDLKIINHSGEEFFAHDYLIKLNLAMECENEFRNKIATLVTTTIPCWETNTRSIDVIENKLNTLNVSFAHQGKFDLSGSMSENSVDAASKQKVMDWCERNENFADKNESETNAVESSIPTDASDILFEDSVSIQNYKPVSKHIPSDETVMGFAGAQHETRKKKYDGKNLPPKPALDVFDMIYETKAPSQVSKIEDSVKSAESTSSSQSKRTKALLELRQKRQGLSAMDQKEEAPSTEMAKLSVNSGSEAGTEEFLEMCKQKNAQSARLEKLKELRKRRTESTTTNETISSNVEEENSNASVSSSRILLLKKIKAKHSKQNAKPIENEDEVYSVMSTNSDVNIQEETKISAHAAKLIKMRNRIKEKYSQQPPTENTSIENVRGENTTSTQGQSSQGYKMPQQIQKFAKVDPANTFFQSEESNSLKENHPSNVKDDLNTEEIVKSPARHEEIRKMRKIISENPFQNMTMVPAGYDISNLSIRKNENHWHTKETTLNDSFEKTDNWDSSKGSQKQSVSRRNEHQNQNFRLTMSRKERKKKETDGLSKKHILDLSLNDTGCPPAIVPEIISQKVTNKSEDLVRFEAKEDAVVDSFMAEPKEVEKLIDLSGNSGDFDVSHSSADASLDPFAKIINEKLNVKDTSREMLLESSSCTNDVSINASSLEDATKKKYEKDTSSSISSGSLRQTQETSTKRFQSSGRSYEASSSSSSSIDKTKIVDKKPVVKFPVKGSLSQTLPQKQESEITSQDSTVSLHTPNEPLLNNNTPSSDQCLNANKFPTTIKSYSSSSSSGSSVRCTATVNKLLVSEQSSSTATNSTIKLNETLTRLPEIGTEASLKTNMIEHLVLAHGNVKVTPIERMSSALFSPEIHQEMENMRLTKMYRIQSYAWAHLIRGNSFFVINTTRTGKTWCYLPPLCNMVSFRLETNCLPQTYGPVAVIIAPYSVQVESIARYCRRLLCTTTTKVTVVPSYAFRSTEDVKIELHNGCGILVITPPSLQRLLVANESESLFNMERIQYVVIDGLDTMTSQNTEFNETLQKFIGPALQNQQNGKVPFQIIVTSKRWSQRMVNLLKISNQPLLCIADYLEALVYAKGKVSIKLQSSAEKRTTLAQYLEKCPYAFERVVIVCNSDEKVDEIEKSLQEAGYACLTYTDRMSGDCSSLINEWKEKTICHQILITTDSVLPEINVQNAWILIHYSMPVSWTKFSFRFSVFLKNYNNLLVTNFEKPTKVPKSLILLDEENNLQLPRLVEFMKHHQQHKHIHPDILNVASQISAEREESRVAQGVGMCTKVLEFGSCDQGNRCPHRHQLTKFDGPSEGIPTEGEVRLKILDVLSPTHYAARLLTHKIGDQWQEIKRSSEVTIFLMQMSLHFMNVDNQIMYWPLIINDICVYKDISTFQRCRLLEIPANLNKNVGKLVNVKVKLIDSGSIIMCKSHDLLIIPEKFKEFPAQAVDVRLSGVIPFDNERVWDSRSTGAVRGWIMTDVKEKYCLQASINFALMETIWVNNLVLMERLPAIRGYAVKISVKRSLLLKGFALADDSVQTLRQFAEENGLLKLTETEEDRNKQEEEINLLEFSKSTNSSDDIEVIHKETPAIQSIISPRKNNEDNRPSNEIDVPTKKLCATVVSDEVTEEWQQLPIDELVQAKISELHDPSKFYIHLVSNDDDLKDLKDLIRSTKKIPLEDAHPMQNCLAPLNGLFHRAKIQRLIIDSSKSVEARVFFCDLGIFSNCPINKLRSTHKTITDYIPFQAICCKLTGLNVECVGEDVQKVIEIENSVHMVYGVLEIPDNNHYDEGFGIHNYEIILYECFSGKSKMQINKLLIERGLASYDEKTKHFLELETSFDLENFDYEASSNENSCDFQSFLDRMQKIMDEEDKESSKLYNSTLSSASKIEEIIEEEEVVDKDKATVLSAEIIESIPSETDQALPALKTLHKRPITTWYETMCMIYLVINAPDISDYHLEVTPKRLIFLHIVNGEKRMLILDLFGYVEPDQVTHEIRGLNVIVRLVKSVYMLWTRLLENPTKLSWLTYDLNAIDAMEVENFIDIANLKPKHRTLSYSSESSCASDTNLCETFTPIVNTEDLNDPMQEMY